jgi:hypothetical protein
VGQHVPKALTPGESEDEQPVKPSGQHRAWLGLLTSWTGEEIQWNNTDLGIVRELHFYYYYYYY